MSTSTRTPVGRRHLLKGAAAVGAIAALGTSELTHVTDAEAARQSVVGTWMVRITSADGSVRVDLTSFTKDGVVIDTGSVPLKAPPKGQASPQSAGLGSWAKAAQGTFDMTFVTLVVGADGAFQGTGTISAHLALGAGGDTITGTFTTTGEVGGQVVFTQHGTVSGTRVKVRPQ